MFIILLIIEIGLLDAKSRVMKNFTISYLIVNKIRGRIIMKQIIPEKSSEKVAKFLKKNSLHKRDFAEMIGVTLSYVYNLIDETVPFSTRGTTIERIATVMDIEPEEFSEYRIPQEPILIDEAIETIKSYIKENKLSVVSFLKSFPRKKRIDIVDILRGALPIPIDYKELKLIGKTLNMPDEEIYNMWEVRLKQVLESAGMNVYANSGLVTSMFDCARKYLEI